MLLGKGGSVSYLRVRDRLADVTAALRLNYQMNGPTPRLLCTRRGEAISFTSRSPASCSNVLFLREDPQLLDTGGGTFYVASSF